jgi:acyl-[acyl-carrier-protein]-phospholipid O-acyltransferase/long-chain-fatty-acid--[acyl-carrier-protein] ligase
MLGYLRADRPGMLQPIPDGWYDTGDSVAIDADGYLTILGRLKRFAKVGGEMVSLAAVEGYVASLWPGYVHAVVTVADAKKGEQLVLLTEQPNAERDALVAFARQHGMAEIAIPRTLISVARVPLLGSGKTDYRAVQAQVEQAMSAGVAGRQGRAAL